jgi:hypothetical protein
MGAGVGAACLALLRSNEAAQRYVALAYPSEVKRLGVGGRDGVRHRVIFQCQPEGRQSLIHATKHAGCDD